MITVKVGEEERAISEVTAQWVNDQLHRRRADGVPVCVRVILKTDCLNMVLATPECQGMGGGGRAPNEKERQLLELWDHRGLNDRAFSSGNVIAFLKQLQRAL